jgi:hypothetical protein
MLFEISRGDIITEGLNKAGRPDLVSDARLWLNLFLEEQYTNQDWNWLTKSDSSLAVVQGGTLPFDYRSAKSATVGEAGRITRLSVIDNPDEWDQFRMTIGQSVGVPQKVYIDVANRTYEFAPAPSSGQTWTLSYYFIPELPDHNDPTTDNLIPVWGLNSRILSEEIKAQAMEYNDDTRQDKAAEIVMKKLETAKMNNHDKRAGSSRLTMGKNFKKRF